MGKTVPTAEGQWRPGGVGARGAGLTPFALARGARPQGDPRLSHADSCRLSSCVLCPVCLDRPVPAGLLVSPERRRRHPFPTRVKFMKGAILSLLDACELWGRGGFQVLFVVRSASCFSGA